MANSVRRLCASCVAAMSLVNCASPSAPAVATAPAAAARPQSAADIGIDIPVHFSDWLRGHYTERVTLFQTYAPMNGDGVAFVGDSITEGWDWNSSYPDLVVRNYGIGGDTTVGLERRLKQVVAARPGKIFLLIGTNDLGNEAAAPETIVANYAIVLDRLAAQLPQTSVFVQSVLPREPHNSAQVRAINAGLVRLAAERRLTFVDIYTPLAVEGGRLDPSVTTDDLHLTEAGYARWRTVIDPLVRGP